VVISEAKVKDKADNQYTVSLSTNLSFLRRKFRIAVTIYHIGGSEKMPSVIMTTQYGKTCMISH
jgi:hypothetical protein